MSVHLTSEDLAHLDDSALRTAHQQLGNNEHGRTVELELIRRRLPPLADLFPEGGYMDDSSGTPVWIPYNGV